MTAPTVYLTNWSSKGMHGPGRRLSIMAMPRAWEHGDGTCHALVPPAAWVRAAKAGTMAVEEYRARYMARLAADVSVAPDDLRDGDTLLCACSREAARRGECHRAWAAEHLARVGWRVVLDGVAVLPDAGVAKETPCTHDSTTEPSAARHAGFLSPTSSTDAGGATGSLRGSVELTAALGSSRLAESTATFADASPSTRTPATSTAATGSTLIDPRWRR